MIIKLKDGSVKEYSAPVTAPLLKAIVILKYLHLMMKTVKRRLTTLHLM